jgi:hypothetical protein
MLGPHLTISEDMTKWSRQFTIVASQICFSSGASMAMVYWVTNLISHQGLDIHYLHFNEMAIHCFCRNPTLREVWGRHSHSRKWDLGVLQDSQKFKAWLQGSKHFALRRYLYHWKRSWSIDVQNGLAWAIWTYVAQVMVERRVGSQTGNLTLDH